MPGAAGEVDFFWWLTDMLEHQSRVAQRILQTISKFLITHKPPPPIRICVPRARGSLFAGMGSFQRINPAIWDGAVSRSSPDDLRLRGDANCAGKNRERWVYLRL